MPVADIIVNVDTASICLSKGLGAPMGAMLVGDGGSIARAFRMRKMLGGGMRQVGRMAAACTYALVNRVGRLVKDRQSAALIANGFRQVEGRGVAQATNMVWMTPPAEHHDALAAHLAADGLLLWPWKPTMRIVTHLDVDAEQAQLLVDSVQSFFSQI